MKPVQRSSTLRVLGLLAIGVVVGRVLPPLAVRLEGQAPVPDWSAAVVLALGAMTVAGIAWHTWRTLHRDKRVMTSRHAIRVLAIAQASIVVSCIFAGGYAGYALAFWGVESDLGEVRFWRSVVAAAAGIALLAAALILEWTCRLPEDDNEDKGRASGGSADPSPA